MALLVYIPVRASKIHARAMRIKLIKKLIIALLVCGLFGGVIRQLNPMPVRLARNETNNKTINSTAGSGKKLIHNAIKQPKAVVRVEADHIKRDDQMNANVIPHQSVSRKNDFHGDEVIHPDDPVSFPLSIDFTWNDVKLIAIRNSNISPQQNQSEDPNDTPIKPDRIHCPSVDKIRQAAMQIDEAFLQDGIYMLDTYDPAFQESDLSWLVMVRGIVTDSSDEAIYKARIVASKARQYKSEYPILLKGGPATLYFCFYVPGDIWVGGVPSEMLVEE